MRGKRGTESQRGPTFPNMAPRQKNERRTKQPKACVVGASSFCNTELSFHCSFKPTNPHRPTKQQRREQEARVRRRGLDDHVALRSGVELGTLPVDDKARIKLSLRFAPLNGSIFVARLLPPHRPPRLSHCKYLLRAPVMTRCNSREAMHSHDQPRAAVRR